MMRINKYFLIVLSLIFLISNVNAFNETDVIADYRFEYNVNDESLSEHNLTNVGGVYENGISGQAINLSGSSYLYTNNWDFDLTNQFSLSSWVYPKNWSTSNWKTLISYGTYASQFHMMYIESLGFYRVYNGGTGGVGDLHYNFSDDMWYHIAFTYDGSNFKLYVNGVEEDSFAYTGNLIDTTNMAIGVDYDLRLSGTYNLSAVIDEFKIYSVGLNASEVFNLYNSSVYYDTLTIGLDNDGATALGYTSVYDRQSQSFEYNQTYCIEQISPRMYHKGTVTDNLVLEIQTDNAGEPSGTLVNVNATSSVTGSSTLNSILADVDFAFSNCISVEANTKYHIVVKRDGALSTINYYGIQRDDNAIDYDVNKFYALTGSSVPLWSVVGTNAVNVKMLLATSTESIPNDFTINNPIEGFSYTYDVNNLTLDVLTNYKATCKYQDVTNNGTLTQFSNTGNITHTSVFDLGVPVNETLGYSLNVSCIFDNNNQTLSQTINFSKQSEPLDFEILIPQEGQIFHYETLEIEFSLITNYVANCEYITNTDLDYLEMMVTDSSEHRSLYQVSMNETDYFVNFQCYAPYVNESHNITVLFYIDEFVPGQGFAGATQSLPEVGEDIGGFMSNLVPGVVGLVLHFWIVMGVMVFIISVFAVAKLDLRGRK